MEVDFAGLLSRRECLLVTEEAFVVVGLSVWDEVSLHLGPGHSVQWFRSVETYVQTNFSWKLSFAVDVHDPVKRVTMGPSIHRMTVDQIDPIGIYVSGPGVDPRSWVPMGGRCPYCGHPGTFVRTALCCPTHGAFAGF